MPTNVKVKAAPDRRCFYTPEGPEIEGDYFRSVPSNDLIESQIASGDLLVEKEVVATVPQMSVVGVSAVDSSYAYQAPVVASSYVGTTSSALPTT